MDNRSEIHDFLTSRRAKITPERPGVMSYGSRRVPGLRRAEVFFAPAYAGPIRPPIFARFNFLDARARDFWIDWDRAADDTVGPRMGPPSMNPNLIGQTGPIEQAKCLPKKSYLSKTSGKLPGFVDS